ncbi:MAG: hypothetical protein M3Z56_06805 [Bacteroidota bacterium]|nr:hypothetical protein [Bacteroidota bacterium]
MKLLKKNTRSNFTDRAAVGIADAILKSQRSFSKKLACLTTNWRRRHQWIFLYLICLLFGGWSFIAIAQSFKTPENSRIIILKSITVPKAIHKESKIYLITEKEFEQVQQFKTNHPGLQKERPQLYNSLNLVEQSYYSQQK